MAEARSSFQDRPHQRLTPAQMQCALEGIQCALNTINNFAEDAAAASGADNAWNMVSLAAQSARIMTVLLTSNQPKEEIEAVLFGGDFHVNGQHPA